MRQLQWQILTCSCLMTYLHYYVGFARFVIYIKPATKVKRTQCHNKPTEKYSENVDAYSKIIKTSYEFDKYYLSHQNGYYLLNTRNIFIPTIRINWKAFKHISYFHKTNIIMQRRHMVDNVYRTKYFLVSINHIV